MDVEIWSDVVCPWCYIGKRRFETALGRFEHADEVRVTWRSFELDPNAPFRPSGTMVDQLGRKYGRSPEEAASMLTHMDEMGAAEGLAYRLAATKGGNTFDAHRLIHLANERSLGGELKEALLRAYFIDLLAVSDPDVLAAVATGVGLDAGEVNDVLSGDRFAAEVRADEDLAGQLGATGVPFFVLDRQLAIPGAQDPDTILAALRRGYDRRPVS